MTRLACGAQVLHAKLFWKKKLENGLKWVFTSWRPQASALGAQSLGEQASCLFWERTGKMPVLPVPASLSASQFQVPRVS